MSISGHKTVSMFMRYNITDGSDKLDALKKTAVHLAALPKEQQDGKIVEMHQRAAAASE
jgi:hypothetical protein